MKKNVMKGFALAMVMAFFASCAPSVDSLISDLEKACKAGDQEKAEKIIEKLSEKEDQLTDDQLERIEDASMLLFTKVLGSEEEVE